MPENRICAVNGCNKTRDSYGFCGMHAYRFKKYGDPLGGGRFRIKGSTCGVDGCGKPIDSHGYCSSHAHRFRRHGNPISGGAERVMGRICSVPGCEKTTEAKGFCKAHYRRYKNHGNPNGGVPRTTKNGEPMKFVEKAKFYFGNDCMIWPFWRNNKGYASVWDGVQNTLVHRIICDHVNGPPPTPKHEAAHSCGNGHMGCITQNHLRWATRKENIDDCKIHETDNRGERNGMSRLTENDIRKIREFYKTMNQKNIAELFGVDKSTISAIVNGRRWKHVS